MELLYPVRRGKDFPSLMFVQTYCFGANIANRFHIPVSPVSPVSPGPEAPTLLSLQPVFGTQGCAADVTF